MFKRRESMRVARLKTRVRVLQGGEQRRRQKDRDRQKLGKRKVKVRGYFRKQKGK